MASRQRQRGRYGHGPSEEVRPANPEIRQYFDPVLPIYGPWSNWQTKPELPSAEEVLGIEESDETISLPQNRIEGAWESKEKYLQSHYELLREDSLSPIRTAVQRLRDDPMLNDTHDISVYEKVSNPIPQGLIRHTKCRL